MIAAITCLWPQTAGSLLRAKYLHTFIAFHVKIPQIGEKRAEKYIYYLFIILDIIGITQYTYYKYKYTTLQIQ